MIAGINFTADFTIYIGSLWLLLSSKVMTRTGSSILLAVIGLSSLGNLVTGNYSSGTEMMLKIGVACGVAFAFWRIEGRHILRKLA